MTWQSAHNARDQHVADAIFDVVASRMAEPVRMVATPRQYIDRHQQWHKGPWAMLVTTKRVILAKAKMLGGAKVELDIPLAEFRRGRAGLHGAGPLFESHSELNTGTIAFLFATSDAATAAHEFTNAGPVPAEAATPAVASAGASLPVPPQNSFTVGYETYLYASGHRAAAERGLAILANRSITPVFELVAPDGQFAYYSPGTVQWGEHAFVWRPAGPGEYRFEWSRTVKGADPAEAAWEAWMAQCDGEPGEPISEANVTNHDGTSQRISLSPK